MKIPSKRSRYQAGCLTTESRSTGTDVYIFRWREPTEDGRSKQRKAVLGTVRELTKTQARKRADDFRQQKNVPAERTLDHALSVRELVEHYQERELCADCGKTRKVIKVYRYVLMNYVLQRWGAMPLSSVKAIAIEEWLRSLNKANGTKAKIREVFGAIFRHAMRHELFPSNPVANVRQARKRSIEPSILEPSEISATLTELEGQEPVRTALLIAALTGMRRGEIFGLKWEDVDFASSVITVRRSYVDGVEGLPKTESSRRPLPIPSQALVALRSWKTQSPHCERQDWIFASEFHFGKHPLWPGTLWRRNVVPALKRAGISKQKLGWHSLRRSFASLLLSEGASLRVSMELMRHSTPNMTLATYAQTIGNENREASRRVAALVLAEKDNGG